MRGNAERCLCCGYAVSCSPIHPIYHAHNTSLTYDTSDCVSHLAEEIPNPRINVPKAILAQYAVGFIIALLYVITIFYSVNDLTALSSNPWPFPLAELYRQATTSTAGSLGLLIVIFLPTFGTNLGSYITSGRTLWVLGRDDATPFSEWIGKIDNKHQNPFNATLICGCVNTVLGCVYIGSSTAFSAFVGSFIILASMSYLAFIIPNIASRRVYIQPGPFRMPNPVFYIIAGLASTYMCVWSVIYCFPYALPFDAKSMNYSCLMVGGLTIITGAWYLWIRRRGYEGPRGKLTEAEKWLADGNEGAVVMGEGNSVKA